MEFSYKIMWQKGLKYFVAFVFPFLVDSFIMAMPDIANLTIGACLLMLCNYLKVRFGLRLP